MKITSPEFGHEEFIPRRFTCDGEDISPPLVFEDIPPDARSLALIVDDPDAPMRTFIHWVVFNIPVQHTIKENSVPGSLGNNDFKRQRYGGPCPPIGTHRYFFKLYALDTELDLPPGIEKGELEKAMKGHILDQAELIGRYKKA
jgi:Raf kinase inhibitor-like YbhB/YbcL family protein